MRRPEPGARLTAEQSAAADRGWKGLMPIRGRPFLDYGLSVLADAGIEEVCLVAPAADRDFRERCAGARGRVRVAAAEQAEPAGSADALAAAEAFAGTDDFLALNSDNLYPLSAVRALADLAGPGLPVFEREALLATSNFARERIDAFAVLDVGPDGFLRSIVEKAPGVAAAGGRVLLSMNLWRFSPSIFEACRRVPVSARGERELPQAVAWAIAHRGARFRTVPCAEGVLDLSTRADVAEVERRLAGVEPRP
jgi:dTDP-glucose pyrophosphorylase